MIDIYNVMFPVAEDGSRRADMQVRAESEEEVFRVLNGKGYWDLTVQQACPPMVGDVVCLVCGRGFCRGGHKI